MAKASLGRKRARVFEESREEEVAGSGGITPCSKIVSRFHQSVWDYESVLPAWAIKGTLVQGDR